MMYICSGLIFGTASLQNWQIHNTLCWFTRLHGNLLCKHDCQHTLLKQARPMLSICLEPTLSLWCT